MKLGSLSKALAGTVLALAFTGGTALATPPAPQSGKSGQKDQKQSLYPNATRKAPKLDITKQATADEINKGLNALSSGDKAKATEILQPYAEGKKGKSKYAQALALQGMANLKYQSGDLKGAISNLQQALALGVMPNDTYFNLMYELAQFYASDNQDQKALDTLHKWRQEGKRETADSYGLEGVINYRMENYKEAVAAIRKAETMTDKPKESWNQVLAASLAETGQSGEAIAMAKKQLAKDPSDATTRHNLIVLLMRAQKYPEAIQTMEEARSKNQLTTKDSYVNLAKLYLITGQNSDKDPKPYADKALAVLKDGLAKGVLKQGYDYYKLSGDAELIGGYKDKALASYTKAAPLGKDGTAELRRAELLAADHKYSAARTAARQALAKGTKHKGKAYMVIAEVERATNHKAAAIKAMQKAAQDPETKDAAEAWLKKAGK